MHPEPQQHQGQKILSLTGRNKMLIEQTIEKLYAMKLNGMVDALKDQLQQASSHDLSFEERFALIVDRQWIWKEDRRMKRLLQNAHLKINGCIEDIDYRSPRGWTSPSSYPWPTVTGSPGLRTLSLRALPV